MALIGFSPLTKARRLDSIAVNQEVDREGAASGEMDYVQPYVFHGAQEIEDQSISSLEFSNSFTRVRAFTTKYGPLSRRRTRPFRSACHDDDVVAKMHPQSGHGASKNGNLEEAWNAPAVEKTGKDEYDMVGGFDEGMYLQDDQAFRGC